jgi:hypothetical protein
MEREGRNRAISWQAFGDLDGLIRLIIAYTIIMTNHDPAKRRRNLQKHGIDLPGCAAAFDGPMITYEDDGDHGEQLSSVSGGLTSAWWC